MNGTLWLWRGETEMKIVEKKSAKTFLASFVDEEKLETFTTQFSEIYDSLIEISFKRDLKSFWWKKRIQSRDRTL